MSQEDKQLLLTDLCARLSYGVICFHPYGAGELESITKEEYGIDVTFKTCDDNYYDIEQCKPYLRPMSSMTEEEKLMYEGLMIGTDNISYMLDVIDWLNAHHFDHRHLIPKDLALEAPEGMYNQNLQKYAPYKYFPIEFSSYEDYVKYLKEKGFAFEAP